MKINSQMASFYNAASRVNSSDYTNRVLATEEVSANALSVDTSATNEKSGSYLNEPPRALQYTQVSPENSYQKQMITDPRFATERMASKLMDKLPNILADMKNLPDVNTSEAVSAMEQAASKIIIRENSDVNYSVEQMQLQDISL